MYSFATDCINLALQFRLLHSLFGVVFFSLLQSFLVRLGFLLALVCINSLDS
jgi:hypothetical protein